MSEAELLKWSSQPGQSIWTFTVQDRFGSYGLTGLLGLRCEGAVAVVEDFLLSCRVMSRKVEETMVHFACVAARETGAEELRATYVPTLKNGPCLEFWRSSGFQRKEGDLFSWDLRQDYAKPSCVSLFKE